MEPPHQRDPWQTPDGPADLAHSDGFIYSLSPTDPIEQPNEAPPTLAQTPPPKPRPVRVAVATALIAMCTIAIMFMQYMMMSMEAPPPEDTTPGLEMVMFGRIAVGFDQIAPGEDTEMLPQMDGQAATSPFETTDRMRVAIIAAELYGSEVAAYRLAELTTMHLAEELEPVDDFLADRALLSRIYSDEAYVPDPSESQVLIERHGWFGELAASYNLAPADAQYQQPRQTAGTAAWIIIGLMVLIFFAILAGFALLPTYIILAAAGIFRIKFQAGPLSHSSAYLEIVAIFFVAFIVLQLLAVLATPYVPFDLTMPMLCLMAVPVLWPLVCGVSFKQYRLDMGLFAPKGILREIVAGVTGYLAGMPIIIAGFFATFVLIMLTGMDGQHPAQREIISASNYQIILIALSLVVWAPLVEELVFRAAFYRHLRRLPGVVTWIAATLLTSFIFAAIHPQGLVGIPVLMSIAIVLAALRQWRGSLVAPITAHALHNGTIATFLIVLLYL